MNSTLVPDNSELVDLLCFMITPNGVQLGGCFVSAIIITNNCNGNKTISTHKLREQLRLQRALIKIILKACAKVCSNFPITLGGTTWRIPTSLKHKLTVCGLPFMLTQLALISCHLGVYPTPAGLGLSFIRKGGLILQTLE